MHRSAIRYALLGLCIVPVPFIVLAQQSSKSESKTANTTQTAADGPRADRGGPGYVCPQFDFMDFDTYSAFYSDYYADGNTTCGQPDSEVAWNGPANTPTPDICATGDSPATDCYLNITRTAATTTSRAKTITPAAAPSAKKWYYKPGVTEHTSIKKVDVNGERYFRFTGLGGSPRTIYAKVHSAAVTPIEPYPPALFHQGFEISDPTQDNPSLVILAPTGTITQQTTNVGVSGAIYLLPYRGVTYQVVCTKQ